MSTILFKENIFYYINNNSAQIVLDCTKLLANKSRIPMHSNSTNALTIPKLLININKQHQTLYQNTDIAFYDQIYLLTDLFLANRLMGSALPIKAAAIGCDNGVLSFHLSALLGAFHPESTLQLVCNQIADNGSNPVLASLAQGFTLPECALSVCDYHKTLLQEHFFDFLVLDDLNSLQEPFLATEEAERILKPGGLLFVLTKNQKLVQHLQDTCPTAHLYPFDTAFLVVCTTSQTAKPKEPTFSETVRNQLSNIKERFLTDASNEMVSSFIYELEELIASAVAQQELSWKIYLLRIKEVLINYRLREQTEQKEYHKRELLLLLKDV